MTDRDRPGRLVFDLERRDRPTRTLRIDGAHTRVIPFPGANQHLVRLATTPCRPIESKGGTVHVLLARGVFDRVADAHGVPRITKLELEPGVAADDVVMHHLGACLDHAVDRPNGGDLATAARVVDAINLHVAQRYGRLGPPPTPARGGLAPWQLRLARNVLDSHLDDSISLEQLAQQCGLSASHFSRAFVRSTGVSPHRWLVRRRIDLAKEMILSGALPLAQVAVACGFADQSHLTRTFANVTGLTPGRWRTLPEFALPPDRTPAAAPV